MPGGRPRKEKRPRSAGSPSCRNRSNDVARCSPPRELRRDHLKSGNVPLTSIPRDPSLRYHRREQGLMLALVSPALLVMVLLIVIPVGWLAWQSIYHDGFTLENYQRILG